MFHIVPNSTTMLSKNVYRVVCVPLGCFLFVQRENDRKEEIEIKSKSNRAKKKKHKEEK